jgi:hypothetical protein
MQFKGCLLRAAVNRSLKHLLQCDEDVKENEQEGRPAIGAPTGALAHTI